MAEKIQQGTRRKGGTHRLPPRRPAPKPKQPPAPTPAASGPGKASGGAGASKKED